jgi:hypothetical protein
MEMKNSIYNQLQQIDDDKIRTIFGSVTELRDNIDTMVLNKNIHAKVVYPPLDTAHLYQKKEEP